MEQYVVQLIMVVFGLMLFVNLVAEVLKQITWNKIPTNLMVFILSIAVSIVAFLIYAQISHIVIVWYMFIFAIAVGFCVAYAAMFGFDKFKQIATQWQDISKIK